MLITKRLFFSVVFLHVLLALIVFNFPLASKIYAYLIVLIGTYIVVSRKDKGNEALYIAAYIVGSEVFLRMTNGNPNYEFGKYGAALFCTLGLYFNWSSRSKSPYFIFLLLLVPGIFLAIRTIHDKVLQNIVFDISGPVCLAICSMYTYKRKIAELQIRHILLALGLPIITCCAYLFLYCPVTKSTYFNTVSSSILSGGFGPNQVATAMGLGMVVFFFRLLYDSLKSVSFLLNLLLTLAIFYRGLLTFSRGGILTGIVILTFVVVFLFINLKEEGLRQWKIKMLIFVFSFSAILVLTWYQTNGLILNRYACEDMRGNFKIRKITTGRVQLALSEIKTFEKSPLLGAGSGTGHDIRKKKSGISSSSHNEMTRMISEHGSLGIAALLILIFTPILLYLKEKEKIYRVSFFLFWLLTVNHSGMRTAAPSFVYALALLSIKQEESLCFDFKKNHPVS